MNLLRLIIIFLISGPILSDRAFASVKKKESLSDQVEEHEKREAQVKSLALEFSELSLDEVRDDQLVKNANTAFISKYYDIAKDLFLKIINRDFPFRKLKADYHELNFLFENLLYYLNLNPDDIAFVDEIREDIFNFVRRHQLILDPALLAKNPQSLLCMKLLEMYNEVTCENSPGAILETVPFNKFLAKYYSESIRALREVTRLPHVDFGEDVATVHEKKGKKRKVVRDTEERTAIPEYKRDHVTILNLNVGSYNLDFVERIISNIPKTHKIAVLFDPKKLKSDLNSSRIITLLENGNIFPIPYLGVDYPLANWVRDFFPLLISTSEKLHFIVPKKYEADRVNRTNLLSNLTNFLNRVNPKAISITKSKLLFEFGNIVISPDSVLYTNVYILDENRKYNPTVSNGSQSIESILKEEFSVREVVYLPQIFENSQRGLQVYTQHSDLVLNFIDEKTVLIADSIHEQNNTHYNKLAKNLQERGFKVVRIKNAPLPPEVFNIINEVLDPVFNPLEIKDNTPSEASYVNSYHSGMVVFVPTYASPFLAGIKYKGTELNDILRQRDNEALAAFESLGIYSKVVPVPSIKHIVDGGAVHCMTSSF